MAYGQKIGAKGGKPMAKAKGMVATPAVSAKKGK